MLKGLFGKLWEVNVITLLLGIFGFILFGYIQENFYGNQNALKPIEELLGNQTSATTYFVVLYLSSAWMLLYLGISELLKFLNSLKGIIGLYLWPLIPLAVYDFYEYYQMIHPTYPDNHILDLVMSVLATTTLWVVITARIKTLKIHDI